MKLLTEFDFGDTVGIDGDRDLMGTVTAIACYGSTLGISYQVHWVHNGDSKSDWFYEWRLQLILRR